MLQKQAEKNYLCSLTDKRKTMKHTNPQVEQMTSFIVMDVLERANELQKQGVDVIHLEVGEPDFDVPACVAEAAKAAYDRHLTHYTHSLGDPELRREIAAFYQREYGVTVDPDCIVVTSGSSPSILLVLTTHREKSRDKSGGTAYRAVGLRKVQPRRQGQLRLHPRNGQRLVVGHGFGKGNRFALCGVGIGELAAVGQPTKSIFLIQSDLGKEHQQDQTDSH